MEHCKQRILSEVSLVMSMGREEDIIRAARMSTGKGFLGWEKDFRLLKYLYKNGHMTPFEMCQLVVDVYCPIFVARQWIRHRTFSYNELSGRYTELPNDVYIPDRNAVRWQDLQNRQGSVEDPGRVGEADYCACLYQEAVEQSFACYKKLLEAGMAREQARGVLPIGVFTRFRASGNLRNWLHFLHLRLDSHAQLEIRQAAEQVAGIVRELWPKTYRLFECYTLGVTREQDLDELEERL